METVHEKFTYDSAVAADERYETWDEDAVHPVDTLAEVIDDFNQAGDFWDRRRLAAEPDPEQERLIEYSAERNERFYSKRLSFTLNAAQHYAVPYQEREKIQSGLARILEEGGLNFNMRMYREFGDLISQILDLAVYQAVRIVTDDFAATEGAESENAGS
jgi:hypothetical protein